MLKCHIFVCYVFGLLIGSTVSASDLVILVHSNNAANLDRSSVASIFLGNSKTFPNGSPAKPVNLEGMDELKSQFNNDILGKTDSQVKSTWSRLVFSGRAQPPGTITKDKIVQAIKDDPSVITYGPSSLATGDVKAIKVE